jgi:two-component system, sensor histidine kinase PdtaS
MHKQYTFPILYGLLMLLLLSRAFAQHPAFPPISERRLQAQKIEQEARANHDSLLLAEAYYLYGKMYAFAGDQVASKTAFIQSLRILEPKGDSYDLGRLYIRLSENSLQETHSQDEVRYAQMALALFKRIKSLKGQVLAYSTLAQVYERKHPFPADQKPDSTLIYLKKAKGLTYELSDSLGMADISLKIGEVFLYRNDPKAIPHLEEALRWLALKKNLRTQLNTTLLLGRAYINAGQNELGLKKINQAARLYDENHLNDHLLSTTIDRAMIHYYEKTNQWKKAFDQFGKLYEKANVQFSVEKDGALARLQVEYDTEKKENKLKAQALELSLTTQSLRYQRIIAICSLLLFIVTGVSSVLFFRLYRKNQRISQKNEHLVWEQKHRARNNLQMVSSLLNMQARLVSDPDSRRAMEESQLRIQSMALIQRKLDENMIQDVIDLSSFIPEHTGSLLGVYGFPQVSPHYTIDPITLETDQAIPVGLILNELITNACKYAFPNNSDPALTIVCQRNRDEIVFKVADNGPGLAITNFSGRLSGNSIPQSFGMQLIHLLVKQVRGSFTLDSSHGTVFTMRFTN